MTPSARRRRRVVRWSTWLIVLAAVLLGAAAAARSMRAPTPVRYQTEPVQRGSLTVAVTATGAVQSLTEVKVGTEISGIVETVTVGFNSRVTRGQVLAKVNTDKLEAQARQMKASLESARADVANAEAAVEETRRTFERSQALFDRTLVSRSDRDAAEAASKRAEASRLSAVARVGQAEANLSALDTDLKKASIRSPIDGIVLDRQIDPGADRGRVVPDAGAVHAVGGPDAHETERQRRRGRHRQGARRAVGDVPCRRVSQSSRSRRAWRKSAARRRRRTVSSPTRPF